MFVGATQFSYIDLSQKFIFLLAVEDRPRAVVCVNVYWNKLQTLHLTSVWTTFVMFLFTACYFCLMWLSFPGVAARAIQELISLKFRRRKENLPSCVLVRNNLVDSRFCFAKEGKKCTKMYKARAELSFI